MECPWDLGRMRVNYTAVVHIYTTACMLFEYKVDDHLSNVNVFLFASQQTLQLQEDNKPGATLHTDASPSDEDLAERVASTARASTSKSTLSMILQDGFAEGVVSVKEALVYISKLENR